MGIETAKKSNNNERRIVIPQYDLYIDIKKKNYEKGGLVFPSRDLYKVLKKINKKLSLLYIKTGEEYDYEPIFDSPARLNDYFDVICKKIHSLISVLKDIEENDKKVGEFLHNYRLTDKFSFLFESIYNAFMEAMISNYDFDTKKKKKQNDKIRKIVSELSRCGVDPFKPQMV